jgi:hypothetical protein
LKKISFVLTIFMLAGIAGGGYWYTTFNKEAVVTSKWLSASFENVRSIHVQGKHGSFMLDAVQDGWNAQVPGKSWNVAARVVPEKVDEFLNVLAELEPYRSIGGFDRGGPEEYGLDSPDLKVIVTFSKVGVDPVTVKLTSDETGRVFGWNSSSPALVYELGKKSFTQLDQPALYFLDTRVLQFDEQAVNKVQLVQPFGSSWLVEKRKEGYYFALPGYLQEKPASDSALKLYIHSLAILRANSLMLEPVVMDKRIPALTIKLWDEKKEPAVVEFFTVKDQPKLYLGKSSWLTVPFTLDAQSVSQLVKSAFDVQGRTVIKLDLGKVTRLIVSHGDNRYGVVRGETGWRLVTSKKDLPGIDMFLWRFTELQFEALPLNNLPDSAVRLMHCKLADDNGESLKELTFYADPKLPQGQCWMKNGGGMYYPVSSRLLKDLQGMFPAGSIGSGS